MTHNINFVTHKSQPAFWKTLLQAEEPTIAKTAMGAGGGGVEHTVGGR